MPKLNLKVVSISLFCFLFFVNNSFAEEKSEQFYKTSADLQRVLLENFDAYEKEEIFRVLATVHTLSPAYMATKEVSNQIFPLYDLKYELLNFRYLMTDEEYALGRVLQKTTKVDGPKFRDNVIDLIVVFKQEKGEWKLWSQVILSIEYLN
jgi:hypothetical protein